MEFAAAFPDSRALSRTLLFISRRHLAGDADRAFSELQTSRDTAPTCPPGGEMGNLPYCRGLFWSSGCDHWEAPLRVMFTICQRFIVYLLAISYVRERLLYEFYVWKKDILKR